MKNTYEKTDKTKLKNGDNIEIEIYYRPECDRNDGKEKSTKQEGEK